MNRIRSGSARRWGAAFVLASSLALAGCASSTPGTATGNTNSAAPAPAAPAAAPQSNSVAGTWNGRYTSSKGASGGSFSMTFTQSGTAVQGTIKLSSACVPTGKISGTLNGSALTFGAIATQGGQPVNFDGTVSGNQMSGSYTAPGCGGDAGSWQASR